METSADHPDLGEPVAGKEAIACRSAQRGGEEAQLLIVADGVGADAGRGGEFAGCHCTFWPGSFHSGDSMDSGTGSRVKGKKGEAF